MWAAQFYRYDDPNTFISSGGLGTMGYGFPAAMGVKLAFPDRIVVDIAGDGEEGWLRILEHRPDILVTDCQMPRLDGLGLIQRMREHDETREIPALMLTAKGFELCAEDLAARLNVLAVLAKPFSPRELLQIVTDVLAGQPVAIH